MRCFAVLLVMLAPLTASAAPGLWQIPHPGDGLVRATVESDLGKHHAFEPVSLAPDLDVGVAQDTAILISSSRSSAGRAGAGDGICLVGPHEMLDSTRPECSERARGLGLRVLRRLSTHFALQAGFENPSASPFTLAATTGMVASAGRGRWWLLAAPSVMVGLFNRPDGNGERVLVPLYAGASIRNVDLHVRTGAETAVATYRDTLAIPVGLGATLDMGRAQLGVEACLDHAFGPQNSLARRSAVMFVQLPFSRAFK